MVSDNSINKQAFKDKLLTNFIPRIELMLERERLHIDFLVNNDSPIETIVYSQKYYNDIKQQLVDYRIYAEQL